MFIKICGITRPEDARAAVQAGADAIGVILSPGHRRSVSIESARRIGDERGNARLVGVVRGVSVDEAAELAAAAAVDLVQWHDDLESEGGSSLVARLERPVIAVVRSASAAVRTFSGLHARLYDGSTPGSGEAWDWSLAREAPRDRPVYLAGGLNPSNVAAAIAQSRPDGVDVSSGVEQTIGVKDPTAMDAFVAAARAAGERASSR